MQRLSMLIDNRERNAEIMDSLASFNVEMSFAQLPVGDYIISDRMCIERKTVQDFESSIIDARLFDQATRLRDAFDLPVIIIEGRLEDCYVSRHAILGTILALYTDYNIQVINSADPSETSYILSKFAEREKLIERRLPRIAGRKKAYTMYQHQLLILESVPGIGPETAKKLISHFSSVKNVCNADVDELMKIDKIGSKKAELIHAVLNADQKAMQ